MACEEFIYSEDNFNLMSFWSDKTQSNFEQILQDTWEAKLKKNVFRYKLNITQSKVLPGKYKFVLKLNPDRVTNRRPPAELNSLNQKFDEECLPL
ncbi:GDP-D-glucose phosphorylase 1-like [Diaphorina citri]|uniref:GDP-D-glucose phosphorylase 1-like n=1 Tax=Diaphorina citri TaxID=121845 RepID=A0A3Q0J7G8_DIACI|nr:GDP-D-glucose phosphorylase 1-like [Diaphorina citri]